MKRKLSNVIIILIILTGLALLLYPTISNYLKSIAYSRAIDAYQQSVSNLDSDTYDDILKRANAYNEDLASREYIMLPFSDEDEQEYRSQLSLPGTDVMGYVVIPKIDVSLPIYHGTEEAILQNGVGHIEGSSLPVGGLGSHSVLAGHRGLVSARLFTDLDRMVLGDTFQIRVLKEVLTYEIDEIKTVLPSDSSILQIDPNEDYCTLMTCTPYGVNSHRLLVRGHRIPTPETNAPDEPGAPDEVVLEDGKLFGFDAKIVLLIAGGLAVILISLLVIFARRWIEKRVRKAKRSERRRRHR